MKHHYPMVINALGEVRALCRNSVKVRRDAELVDGKPLVTCKNCRRMLLVRGWPYRIRRKPIA